MNVQTTVYGTFKGVDKAHAATDVAESRSPYAPNLIAGNDGFPEKRVGWRVLHQLEGKVHGITTWTENGHEYVITHTKNKLTYDGTEMAGTVANGDSCFFVFCGALYLVGSGSYRKITYNNGVFTHQDVCEIAYIPTILISRNPDGGGTEHEAVNLLSAKRKVAFLSDGTSTVYALPQDGITAVDEVKLGNQVKTVGTDYTVNLAEGKITFTAAPPKAEDYEDFIEGQDTVFVTYSKTNAEYVSRIKNCTIVTTYGYGAADRVFFSGNPNEKNTDWMSGYLDATYFPDTGYAKIGGEETAIMGYAHIGKYLAIIKEEGNGDGTVFMRHYETLEDKPVFPVEMSAAGVGMIAKNTVAAIDDEPLFLSRSGVYAITTARITNLLVQENSVQNRSWFVNNDIVREQDLQNACAVSWQNKYLLAANGNVYVLDGAQNHAYTDKTSGAYVYECYEWLGIPAVCFYAHKGDLYFGTEDGKVCRMNSDVENLSRYSDGGTLGENGFVTGGAPIAAAWATKTDADGDFMSHKTLLRQGCGIMVKPYSRSNAAVLLRTDIDFGTEILQETMDIFDWEYIDFSRLTFRSVDSPQVIPMRWRVKNYITLQIVVKNDAIDEGFGVLGIIKRYTKNRFVR